MGDWKVVLMRRWQVTRWMKPDFLKLRITGFRESYATIKMVLSEWMMEAATVRFVDDQVTISPLWSGWNFEAFWYGISSGERW
jgi:hypothetical protein